MQAQYTDLILLNKYELVTERELDIVIDSVNDLNTDTPKLKWSKDCADTSLIFDLSVRPFTSNISIQPSTVLDMAHHSKEIDLIHITLTQCTLLTTSTLDASLAKLDKEYIYRVKGILQISTETCTVLNWAFGRCTFTDFPSSASTSSSKVTVMGIGLERFIPSLQEMFVGGEISFLAAASRDSVDGCDTDTKCALKGPHSH